MVLMMMMMIMIMTMMIIITIIYYYYYYYYYSNNDNNNIFTVGLNVGLPQASLYLTPHRTNKLVHNNNLTYIIWKQNGKWHKLEIVLQQAVSIVLRTKKLRYIEHWSTLSVQSISVVKSYLLWSRYKYLLLSVLSLSLSLLISYCRSLDNSVFLGKDWFTWDVNRWDFYSLISAKQDPAGIFPRIDQIKYIINRFIIFLHGSRDYTM